MRPGYRTILLLAMPVSLAACADGGDDAPDAVEIVGTDALGFEPDELRAAAGTVQIQLTAEEAVEHTVVIEELDDERVVAAAAGETVSGDVELTAGTYTLYCDVPGHRAGGMEAVLTVEG